MVRRAGGGADPPQLLLQERQHPGRVQQRLGLLVQERLVGRAAALGHEEELVGVLVARIGVCGDLDLCGEVRTGVLLLPHGDRCVLRVAQVELGVGVEDALGKGLLVDALREDVLSALRADDRSAGVLTHREDAAGGDVGVLEEVEGDELVVVAGLFVVEDVAQLLQVRGAQVVRDVVHCGLGEQGQRFGRDLQELPPIGTIHHFDALCRQQAVRGLVLPRRQHVFIPELGH